MAPAETLVRSEPARILKFCRSTRRLNPEINVSQFFSFYNNITRNDYIATSDQIAYQWLHDNFFYFWSPDGTTTDNKVIN